MLFTANTTSNTVSVINRTTGAEQSIYATGKGPYDCLATPDGKYLYVSNNTDNTVSIIWLGGGYVGMALALIAMPQGVPNMVSSANGARVYTVTDNSVDILIIDATTFAIIATIPPNFTPGNAGEANYITVTPSESQVWLSASPGSGVSIFVTDLATQAIVETITIATPITDVPQINRISADWNRVECAP